MVADLHRCTFIDFANHAHGFIAWHQRITQTRKGRHAAVPEQAFGTCADATESDIHFYVAGFKRLDLQGLQGELLWRIENNGLGGVAHGASSK